MQLRYPPTSNGKEGQIQVLGVAFAVRLAAPQASGDLREGGDWILAKSLVEAIPQHRLAYWPQKDCVHTLCPATPTDQDRDRAGMPPSPQEAKETC